METVYHKQIVIYHDPQAGWHTGPNAIPQEFVITLYQDRVEVRWGVSWCRGGAGNTEILSADYFSTHTIDEFDAFVRKAASDQFADWFQIKTNQKILNLFGNCVSDA